MYISTHDICTSLKYISKTWKYHQMSITADIIM